MSAFFKFPLIVAFFTFVGCSGSESPPQRALDAGQATVDAAAGAPADSAVKAFPTASGAALQRSLDESVASGVTPGAVVFVRHQDDAAWAGSAGVANIDSKEALQASHRFRAGSTLKMFVATAMLQLVEHKQRSLDETLTTLLPPEISARVPHADQITVRMLLNHTSGIPDWAEGAAFDARAVADPLHPWSLTEQLDLIANQPLKFAPGTSWAYSNTNYTLLGEILSLTTNQPWRRVLRERVIARAKLTETTLPEVGDAACSGCAHGYEFDEEAPASPPLDVTVFDPSMAGAAGGSALITSAADLAAFLCALMRGELFDDAATLQTMLTFVAAPLPEELQTGYGLGVIHDELGDTVLLGHLGGTAGFQSFMLYLPGTQLVVTGFMNRRGDLGALLLPILELVREVR